MTRLRVVSRSITCIKYPPIRRGRGTSSLDRGSTLRQKNMQESRENDQLNLLSSKRICDRSPSEELLAQQFLFTIAVSDADDSHVIPDEVTVDVSLRKGVFIRSTDFFEACRCALVLKSTYARRVLRLNWTAICKRQDIFAALKSTCNQK